MIVSAVSYTHLALKDPRVYNFGGDTMHPCREYPTKTNISMSCRPEVNHFKKAFAHITTSLIPVKSVRKNIRDCLLYTSFPLYRILAINKCSR